MSRNAKRLVSLTLLFFLVTRSIQAQTFTAPYQIRSIMFRVMDFFNDAIDDPSYDPTSQTRNIPPAPTLPPAPTGISGACPFQATAFVRECLDYSCSQTKPLSAFDSNQQYGVANDLRIQNQGNGPDPSTPFGHAGSPGEVVFQTANLTFPTSDGYRQQDPADVKLFFDDVNFEIGKKECESFGVTNGCPNGQKKYSSTDGPLGTVMNLLVDCNVNMRYGWLLRKKSLSTTTAPTARPTNPASGRTGPQPTSSAPTPSQNTPTTSQPSSTTSIKKAIDAVSLESLKNNLQEIVDKDESPGLDEAQTRYSTFPGYQTESAYMKKQFENAGIPAEFQDFSIRGLTTRNIIAHIPGTGPHKDEYYLVVAHLDSTSSNSGPTNDPAPGADDNGSGSVAVFEIAKAVKQSGIALDYSVDFILFSGEEQGLLGSNFYVSNMGSKQIKGVINLDMLGWSKTPGRDCTTFGYRNYDGGNVIADTMKQINDSTNIGLEVRVGPSSISSSDHGSFWNKNITAIFGYECDLLTSSGVSNPNYHKITDQTNYMNFSQLTKATKVVAGGLTQLTKL